MKKLIFSLFFLSCLSVFGTDISVHKQAEKAFLPFIQTGKIVSFLSEKKEVDEAWRPPYKVIYRRLRLKAIIMAGQSNCEGGVLNSPSSTYLGHQNAWIFYKPDTAKTDNGAIQTYIFGKNNAWRAVSLTYTGAEVAVGYNYNLLTGEYLLIIKYSLGGSFLVDDLVSTRAAGIWSVTADATRANGYQHYRILVDNYVIPCILYCEKSNTSLEIISIVWIQGEADTTVLYCADNYQTKLIELFDAIKARLEPYGVISPVFKPLIVRIHNNFTPGTRPYLSTVRTALENVAAHYNSAWINTDALTVHADNTHWPASSQEILGDSIANRLNSSLFR